MQQLAPRDALFLSMETPTTPTHIGGLVFLKPEPDSDFGFDRFVEFVSERLLPIDRFSWHIQEVPFGLDRPYWVKQGNFDPADHIHSIRIPAPYSPEKLSQLAGRIFERPMDRSRPLWDMVLIEGLPQNGYALLWRMHHCLMDGASGVNLSEQLFDISPDGARISESRIVETLQAGQGPSATEMTTQAIRNATRLPARQAHYARKLIDQILPKSRTQGTAVEASSADEPGLAPRALFNGINSRHRRIAWSSIPLEDVKRAKNTVGATVNDVVLSITAGAVRDYHLSRGALPKASFVAGCPVSLRTAGDNELGNQVRDLAMYWGTDVENPIGRLVRVSRQSKRTKESLQSGESLDLYGLLSEALLPGFMQLFARGTAAAGEVTPLPLNAVVSNVPMAPIPLYCAGALIEQVFPISVLGPSQGLNITVVSYAGQLHFGIVYDPELLESGWELADAIPKQLMELQAAIASELPEVQEKPARS